MNENKIMGWLIAAGFAVTIGFGLLSPAPAQANSQYATASGWIYKSTYTQTAETAQHIPGANGGAIFGSVIISSAVNAGTYIVYDSSDSTTSGREVLSSGSCQSMAVMPFNVEADLGLTYTTAGGCKVTFTYLEHK